MTVDEILNGIDALAPEAIGAVLDGLCPVCLAKVPVELLVKFATDIARVIEAKNEKAAVAAGVKAADAAADAAEDEAIKAAGGS